MLKGKRRGTPVCELLGRRTPVCAGGFGTRHSVEVGGPLPDGRGTEKAASRPFAGVRWPVLGILVTLQVATASADLPVLKSTRLGVAPPWPGEGWLGECFLNIPDASAAHLIFAEHYVAKAKPDFTFSTRWIDFPGGPGSTVCEDCPTGMHLDSEFATVGDFLNDYIYDVSDPSQLLRPMSHMLIRFSGYLAVTFEHDTDGAYGLDTWVHFFPAGFDGYRVTVANQSWRNPRQVVESAFALDFLIFDSLGMYPIQATYFNRYDPKGALGAPLAGFELYSWHGSELALPGGERWVHQTREVSTIVPPEVIYQPGDEVDALAADIDADRDVDLYDLWFLQNCYTGPGGEKGGFDLTIACTWWDEDHDRDVDEVEFTAFQAILSGPE